MKKIVEATPALENVLKNAAVLRRNLIPPTAGYRKTDSVSRRSENDDFDGPFRLSLITRNGTQYLRMEETLNGTALGIAGKIAFFQQILNVPVQEQVPQFPAAGNFTRIYLTISYNFTAGTATPTMEQSAVTLYSIESADRFLVGLLKSSGSLVQILQPAPAEPLAIFHRIIV